MIDRIGAWLEMSIDELNPLEELKAKKNIFYLRNMRIKQVAQNRIFISGSITKFFIGNNKANLNITGILKAVKEFCKILNVSEDKIYLGQIEIGYNFKMKNEPFFYLRMMRNVRGYEYSEKNSYETIGYKMKTYQVICYDKSKELIDNKEFSKENLDGLHLIRYELKILKNLKNMLKLDGMTRIPICILYEKKVLKRLLQLWYLYFNKIVDSNENSKVIIPKKSGIRTFRDFKNSLASYTLSKRNLNYWYSILDKFIDDNKKCASFRKQLENLINKEKMYLKHIELIELSQKVRKVYNRRLVELKML